MVVFEIFLANFLFLPDFVPDSRKFIELRTMADFVKRKLVQRPIPEKNISHFGTLPDNTKKMEGNCSQIFLLMSFPGYYFFVREDLMIHKQNIFLFSKSL